MINDLKVQLTLLLKCQSILGSGEMFKDQLINLCLMGFTVSCGGGGIKHCLGLLKRLYSRTNVQNQHMRDDHKLDQKSVKKKKKSRL